MKFDAAHKNLYAKEIKSLRWLLDHTHVDPATHKRFFKGQIDEFFVDRLARLMILGYKDTNCFGQEIFLMTWESEGNLHTVKISFNPDWTVDPISRKNKKGIVLCWTINSTHKDVEAINALAPQTV